MGEVKITRSDLYAARVFFNAALPLLRVTVESKPALAAKFAGKSFVFQVSALYSGAPGGRRATPRRGGGYTPGASPSLPCSLTAPSTRWTL